MIIKYVRTPDGYRGALDCKKIVTPHTVGNIVSTDTGYIEDIIIGNKLVCKLEMVRGNNGEGADACSIIHKVDPSVIFEDITERED